MAQNKVMKLWTAVITAFLALCTTLGLITTTAVEAVAQTGTPRNHTPHLTVPALSGSGWASPGTHSLPPTMKQRLCAEAHGSSPSCRHRPLLDEAAAPDSVRDPLAPDAEPDVPLPH